MKSENHAALMTLRQTDSPPPGAKGPPGKYLKAPFSQLIVTCVMFSILPWKSIWSFEFCTCVMYVYLLQDLFWISFYISSQYINATQLIISLPQIFTETCEMEPLPPLKLFNEILFPLCAQWFTRPNVTDCVVGLAFKKVLDHVSLHFCSASSFSFPIPYPL